MNYMIEPNYELRAEWLADHGRTEDDILQDDDGDMYVMVEKTEWAEVDGRDMSYEDGYKKCYLPDNLQF